MRDDGAMIRRGAPERGPVPQCIQRGHKAERERGESERERERERERDRQRETYIG